ncbi:MFS transporter [Herbiconiux sp. CPCC 205716]|uniref:MFS transporter n=1 Tax=Herbiconiux gentiana TaxID=2970912 RepID=A0ABT2GDI9_9MICO|nr:MFS transporter [Herbiconiux gentiana]MCS5714296.1 MFS transporter [Herbiconiux gentiana]
MTAPQSVRSNRAVVPAGAWRMLGLGLAGQSAGSFLVSAPAFLIPYLHVEQGVPLTTAGWLAAAPTIGMVLTLVAWGALADRVGERGVIAGGLALTAVAAGLAALAASVPGALAAPGLLVLFLVLGGAASASTNSASGRVVVGWFPRERRGLAMGIRQMAQPLGTAVAALVVPPLAATAGFAAPLALAAVATGLLAVGCALGIRNPPRPAPATSPASPAPAVASTVGSATPAPAPAPAARAAATAGGRAANPYRRDRFLVRIHAVSVLLVLPQFTLSTFGLVWLVAGLGVEPLLAGVVVSVSQFVGAGGRIAIGALSDRVGSRVRVLRAVCVAGIVLLAAMALLGGLHLTIAAAIVFVLATTVSVADNGLAFTSVAEAAGSAWAGRALGVQNTGQFLAASAVGPGVAALIALVGYPVAFALIALAPLAALPLVPRRDANA